MFACILESKAQKMLYPETEIDPPSLLLDPYTSLRMTPPPPQFIIEINSIVCPQNKASPLQSA